MVSDEELVGRLQRLLCQVDLSRATALGIRQQLEGEFGVELRDRDDFIRHHIAAFVQQCHYSSLIPPSPSPSQHQHYYTTTPTTTTAYPSLPHNIPHSHSLPQSQYHVQQLQHHPHPKTMDMYMDNTSHKGGHTLIFDEQLHQQQHTSVPPEGKKRSRAGGLNKVCSVSPELQAIVGEPKMPRTQIVKQLWAYIRANNLQDPNNKRIIVCNDALRLVFGTDSTDMFQMNKLLARHIKTIDVKEEILEPNPKRIANENAICSDSAEPVSDSTAAVESEVVESDVLTMDSPPVVDSISVPSSITVADPVVPISDSLPVADSVGQTSSSLRVCNSVVQTPDLLSVVDSDAPSDSFMLFDSTVPISNSLASFLGTDEIGMPLKEVLKQLCDYIKEKDLQDPTEEGRIICDDKLQKLFSRQNFIYSDMAKLLAPHLSR